FLSPLPAAVARTRKRRGAAPSARHGHRDRPPDGRPHHSRIGSSEPTGLALLCHGPLAECTSPPPAGPCFGTLSAQRNEGGPLLSIFGDPDRPRTRNASFTKRHAASSRGRHERASRPKWAKIADGPRGHAMTEGNVKQWHGEGAVRDRLNRPVRDLRISVIDRCNYRCPYCMPADVYGDGHEFLPRAHWL